MAFTPTGFVPDPEHVEAGTIAPNNPRVSAAALADADAFAKPHTAADDNAPALEPGQSAPPPAASAPAAPYMPPGFVPDKPKDEAAEQGYHSGDVAQLTKAGLPQDRAIALAKKLYEQTDQSGTWAPMSTARKLTAGVLSTAMGGVGAAEGSIADVVQNGRFSTERLGDFLKADAAAAKASPTGGPFQEWQKIVPQLADEASKSSIGMAALKFMRAHPYWGYGFGGSAQALAIYHGVKMGLQALKAAGE